MRVFKKHTLTRSFSLEIFAINDGNTLRYIQFLVMWEQQTLAVEPDLPQSLNWSIYDNRNKQTHSIRWVYLFVLTLTMIRKIDGVFLWSRYTYTEITTEYIWNQIRQQNIKPLNWNNPNYQNYWSYPYLMKRWVHECEQSEIVALTSQIAETKNTVFAL